MKEDIVDKLERWARGETRPDETPTNQWLPALNALLREAAAEIETLRREIEDLKDVCRDVPTF